jgi:restriction endonuclease
LPLPDILKKIQSVQVLQNLPVSNAFKQTKVSAVNLDIEMEKHVYFVAETKGSMSSMEIRPIEETKIKCAQKFFAKITSDQVKYDVVNSYSKLMELVH